MRHMHSSSSSYRWMEGGGRRKERKYTCDIDPIFALFERRSFYTSLFRTGFNNSSSLDVFSASVDGGRFRRSGYDHLRSFLELCNMTFLRIKMTLGDMHYYCPVKFTCWAVLLLLIENRHETKNGRGKIDSCHSLRSPAPPFFWRGRLHALWCLNCKSN